MKNRIFCQALWLVLVGVFAIACTETKDNSAELAALQERIRQVEKENQDLRKAAGNTGLTSPEPTAEYNDAFLTDFCSLLKPNLSAAELEPYLSERTDPQALLERMRRVAQLASSCEMLGKKIYDHPFDIAEYKLDNDLYLYMQVTYDTKFKVMILTPAVFDEPLELSAHKVPTQDGVELTTYLAYKKNASEKLGTIFLRTPYMVYGSYIYFIQMAMEYNKAIVIQANRGSHSSGGEFKWLEKQNIEDSRDTLDWITQQPMSNGKVMAWGVSYDGFDALATAATNHPALKSVIACSAPANAATDSFTSSQFVENGIFGYVTTDRRTETLSHTGEIWELIATDITSYGRQKMDDILLGFDSQEWNETSAAVDDLNHSYWQERQLLEEVSLAQMPILHVAGLKRDQDGRDTLLAYNYIQQHSTFKEQNYLALHKDGHGCGDSFRLKVYQDMMALTDSDSSSVDLSSNALLSHYTLSADDYQFANSQEALPLTNKNYVLPESFELYDFNLLSLRDPEDYEKVIEMDVTESMNINGAPTMTVFYQSSVPEVPVHIFVYALDPNGNFIPESLGWRTGFISRGTDPQSVDLTFPLVNATVPAGSKIVVAMSTRNDRVFTRQPQAHSFIDTSSNTLKVSIFSEPNQETVLNMPIESSTNLP